MRLPDDSEDGGASTQNQPRCPAATTSIPTYPAIGITNIDSHMNRNRRTYYLLLLSNNYRYETTTMNE